MLYKENGTIYFEYENNSGKITIINFTRKLILDEYRIPDEINGVPVEILGKSAFSGCHISRIIVGSNVVRIEEQCFENSDVEEIIFCAETLSVQRGTFRNCRKLRHINTDSFRAIHAEAFSGCEMLEMAHIIADHIGRYAFRGCSSLKRLKIYAKNISYGAFEGCSNLAEASIAKCEQIQSRAFADCPELNKVIIGKELKTIENNAFDAEIPNVTILNEEAVISSCKTL